MKSVQILEFLAFAALSTARPLDSRHISNLVNREVPQEHSHEKILTSVASSLNLNNPAGIKDPVFALLGNAVCLTPFWTESSNILTTRARLLRPVLAPSLISTAFSKMSLTRPSPTPRLLVTSME